MAISACDRESHSNGVEEVSGASGQYPLGRAAERLSDSHPPRVSGDHKDHRSTEMKEFLNSPSPQWLTLDAAIRPEERDSPPDHGGSEIKGFMPSGGSKVFELDGKTIQFPFPASEMTWIAFSPSANQVVVERGEIAEVRSVGIDGTVSDSGSPLPALNFESDRRWMLTRWLWISEHELVTALNRPTASGDVIEESKVYYYNVKTKKLREIDLPDGFINPVDPYVEVLGTAGRDAHVRTLAGEAWFGIPEAP